MDPQTAFQAGATIGGLHRALAQLEAPVEEENLPETLRTWALTAAKEALDLTAGWCEDFLAALSQLWPVPPRQIIHRDLNPGNLVRDGARWGFLDFELSRRSVRIYDLAYAATAVLSETYPDSAEAWLTCYRNLLAGYDATAGLTEAERRAVPYVLTANQFVCTAWFAGKEKYRDLFETNKAMTKWLLERFGEL